MEVTNSTASAVSPPHRKAVGRGRGGDVLGRRGSDEDRTKTAKGRRGGGGGEPPYHRNTTVTTFPTESSTSISYDRKGRGGGRGDVDGIERGRKSSGRSGRGSRNGSGRHHGGGRTMHDPKSPTDEDVMIEFMYYLRAGHVEARSIHAKYNGKPKPFIEAVRIFLTHQKENLSAASDCIETKNETPIPSHEDTKTSNEEHNHPSLFPSDKESLDTSRNNTTDCLQVRSFGGENESNRPQNIDVKDDGDNELERMVDNLTMHGSDDTAEEVRDDSILSPSIHDPSKASVSTWTGNSEQTQGPENRHTVNNHVKEVGSTEVIPETSAPKWQPKRTCMRLYEQKGKLLVNGFTATPDSFPHVVLGPRKKIIATWSLPLEYLKKRAIQKYQEENQKSGSTSTPTTLSVRSAIENLTIGLFRRGCPENTSAFSIVAKPVIPSEEDAKDRDQMSDFRCEINEREQIVWGTVPFFTPRTPGNVILRLYFADNVHETLATSQCIRILVTVDDLESVLRFILSNIKGKKGNVVSSIFSITTVMEQFTPPYISNGDEKENVLDGAGRALFGCFCETRKVVEAHRAEHFKKKELLSNQESFKLTAGDENLEEEGNACNDSNNTITDKEPSARVEGERLGRNRKWIELQSAYASLLKSLLLNPSTGLLLKRDLLQKIRLENELWCPFSEEFAENPFPVISDGENSKGLFRCPHSMSHQHFQLCRNSLAEIQKNTLGFIARNISLDRMNTKPMEELSIFMKEWYINNYSMTADATQKREYVRLCTETIVSRCPAFPKGTRVVIFGSSANGFGSKNSDVDMCIQMHPSFSLVDKDDTTGSNSMALLAKHLEEAGMVDVNVSRLSARVPVLMFKISFDQEGQKTVIDCDLSMQNPLAVLNTQLLLHYATIAPDVQVLAAVVKLWAKRRNLNSPSNHTLSSYGYILMLLYFLTTHEISDDGNIVSLFPTDNAAVKKSIPIIPNLQWMNPSWHSSPVGTPYEELAAKPYRKDNIVNHPMDSSFFINTYFFRIENENALRSLQARVSFVRKDSLGLVLAAFFRFYAYEFDYKKHVVSLNATLKNGPIEREAKAEYDGWKGFSQCLCIEDPFECFYDVAHVLKPSTFQKLRREFSLGYVKITDWAASFRSGQNQSVAGLIDNLCEAIITPDSVSQDA